MEREANHAWMFTYSGREFRCEMFTSVTRMISTQLKSTMQQNALVRIFDHFRGMSDKSSDN